MMPLAGRAAAFGLALRGGFHPAPEDGVPGLPDGRPAATLLMLGWTGGVQWPVFAASAEHADGRPDPLDRWSVRLAGMLAAEFGGMPLFPFGGPPFLPFQRWAMRAEAVHPSPIGLLIHPRWGLWHAWRAALAFPERLDLPEMADAGSPCAECAGQPCRSGGRAACPVGTPYGAAQAAFHAAAARGKAGEKVRDR